VRFSEAARRAGIPAAAAAAAGCRRRVKRSHPYRTQASCRQFVEVVQCRPMTNCIVRRTQRRPIQTRSIRIRILARAEMRTPSGLRCEPRSSVRRPADVSRARRRVWSQAVRQSHHSTAIARPPFRLGRVSIRPTWFRRSYTFLRSEQLEAEKKIISPGVGGGDLVPDSAARRGFCFRATAWGERFYGRHLSCFLSVNFCLSRCRRPLLTSV
jgi:hypothetical protein